MQRLLDQTIHQRRDAERPHPTRRLGDIHSAYRTRQIPAFQQRLPHTRPVHLQPVLELRHGDAIDARRTLVPNHPLVRQPHVGLLDHALHPRAVLRFRSPVCRRIDLDTSGQRPSFRLGPCSKATVFTSASVESVDHEISRPTLGVVVRPFGIAAYSGLC